MAAAQEQFLILPGEDAREVWHSVAGGAWTRTADSSGKNGVLALECLALDSAPFWARTPAGGVMDLPGVAALHWEALGLENGDEGRAWTHWKVVQEDGRVLVGSSALCRDAPQNAWLEQEPSSCELSALLYSIPTNEAALWKEAGRFVVAFTRDEVLLHFSVLSSRELDESAAIEIHELVQALEMREMLPKLKGIRIWCDCGQSFSDQLKTSLDSVKVRVEEKPAPRLPAKLCELDPPEIARARRLGIKRRRVRRAVLLGAALYLAVFAVWIGSLFFHAQKLSREQAQLDRQEPELAVIRNAQLRSQALEAATNPDAYPLEVFNRIGTLLPPEGIRLEEFIFDTVDAKKIVVRGIASSSRDALKFQADIKNSDQLKQYPWNAPVPAIRPDNQATFRVDGALARNEEAKP